MAASYRGLPVALSAHAFIAREKPGSQRVVRRPDFDVERRGGWLETSWERALPAGWLRIDGGGGASSVELLSGGEEFSRGLGSVRARATARRVEGKTGFGFDLETSGAAGRTDAHSWSQFRAVAGVTGFLPVARLSASGGYGDTGGSPTRFDLFSIGGAPSSTLPAGLDRNRVELPALPAFVQTGERVESLRAEIALAQLPLVVYAERLRAWTPDADKPEPVRVLGAELRIDERILPAPLSGDFAFYAGVAKVRSTSPRFDSTRGYAGLLYRP